MRRQSRTFGNACCCLLGVAGLLLAGVSPAPAAEFVISPLRVTLDRSTRSSQIEIRNDDRQPLRIQLQAMAWTQDAEGRDQYVESDGLLYFPKALEIPPGESRIVRLASKSVPVTLEDAYRLYVEELPVPSTAPAPGAVNVRVLLRVGVAVFVSPVEPKSAGEIRSLELRGGAAQLTVSNTGNVNITADRLVLIGTGRDGKELFRNLFPDRYFLAGATRRLRMPIPRELCRQLASLEAVVIGQGIYLKQTLDVPRPDCQ